MSPFLETTSTTSSALSTIWDTGTAVSGTTGSTTDSWLSDSTSTAMYPHIIDRQTYHPSIYGQFQTTVGTEVQINFVQEKDKKVLHPQLYFKFVKSKLSKLEEKKLNKRLLMLQKMVKKAEDLGQKALYEEFARKIAITVREQELYVCGIEYFIGKDIIKKYMNKVKDVAIKLKELEDFDRPIPNSVAKRIKKFQDLEMFDKYFILYLDYKEKTDIGDEKKVEKELKTNKQKIKEKDPIVFGVQNYLPNKFYFIADWIDEYCDLTLDKLLDTVRENDPDYEVDTLQTLDEDLIQRMVKESRERFNRLKETKPGTYKKLMEKEDLSYLKKENEKSGEKELKNNLKDIISKHVEKKKATKLKTDKEKALEKVKKKLEELSK